MAGRVSTNGGVQSVQGFLNPLGYQQISPVASPQSLTPPTYSRIALIQCEADSVRWRDDGTAPTPTVGMLLAAGDSMVYSGDLTAIQFCQVTAGGILNISYYE